MALAIVSTSAPYDVCDDRAARSRARSRRRPGQRDHASRRVPGIVMAVIELSNPSTDAAPDDGE
jgi:hypothetical protein